MKSPAAVRVNMTFGIRAIRVMSLGCMIALAGVPSGVTGLSRFEPSSAADLETAESNCLLPGSQQHLGHRQRSGPPQRGGVYRALHVGPMLSSPSHRFYPAGRPPGFFIAGHQLANGLNAPLLN